MVVTGDRDAYQLVGRRPRADHDHLARHHRHPGLRPRGRDRALRHPAGAGPRLHRPQGRHLRQHPGRPGHRRQDRRRSCCSSSASLEEVLAHVDEISGAKRKENLREHADDARISKQLATIMRDIAGRASTSTRRSRASPTARGCARSSATSSCATRCAGSRRRSAPPRPRRPRPEARRARTVPRARGAPGRGRPTLPGDELALVAAPPEVPEGELLAARGRLALRRLRRRRRGARRRRAPAPAELVAAAGDRPVIAHDAKALGDVPAEPRLRHRGRGLPARPGAPRLPARRAGRGARHRRVDADDRDGRARRARRTSSRRCQREQLARARARATCCDEIELPLVRRAARDWRRPGIKLDTRPARARSPRAIRAEADELEREIWELAGEEFTIGSPQQLAAVLFEKLGLSRKRRGKTGFSTDARVLQAIRDEHEIIPKIERWRELTKLAQTYLDALPALIIGDDGRLHTTLQPDRRPRPAACRRPTRTSRTSRSAPSSAARSAAASSPSRATC